MISKRSLILEILLGTVRTIFSFMVGLLIVAWILSSLYQDKIIAQNEQLNRIEHKLDTMITLQKMDMSIYEKGIELK